MAALAATSSATPSLQSTLLKSRVQQARREADQAEANAENLRLQAEEQDRVVQQARQRAQGFEIQAQTASSSATPTAAQPTTTQVQSLPTYESILAGVFSLAKSILAGDLSSTQKNVVNNSLFTLAAETWAKPASSSAALQSYSKQVAAMPEKTPGSVLNTSA